MKRNYLMVAIIALLASCSGGGSKPEEKTDSFDSKDMYGSEEKKSTPGADDSKGIGKFTNIELGATLDQAMVENGTKVYDVKCNACHKLSDEKLVGPGWKGVTSRRKAEWVMNFVTNVDEMLSKDASAQAMLEECLVRMPNQNLSDEDARSIYEFMRKNDGVK